MSRRHPDVLYVVTARHGGSVIYGSWSRAKAVEQMKRMPGDFVVVKYLRALPHKSEDT